MGAAAFGSNNMAFWLQKIKDSRLSKTFKVQGKEILGLLETGSYIFYISGKDSPKSWDMCVIPFSVIGLGQTNNVAWSSGILQCSHGESSETFHPYVISVLPYGVETC